MKVFKVEVEPTKESIKKVSETLSNVKGLCTFHWFPASDDKIYFVVSVDDAKDLPVIIKGWSELICV